MEKDLEILRSILMELKYTPHYIDILINHVKKEFEKSTLGRITSNFLYAVLLFEEGRSIARDIADYFEDYKKKGSFKTKIQNHLDTSRWMK